MSFYTQFIRPLLFMMDAEKAHHLALSIAEKTHQSNFLQSLSRTLYTSKFQDPVSLWGLHFPNRIGLAAGFDKNGTTPLAMQALGFGFIEIGSITAKSSLGNPKPRAFRLPKDRSLINRMGLNNEGTDAIIKRLTNTDMEIPLGVNIAKTNDSAIHGTHAVEDYVYSYLKAQRVADYITINISCPNTGEGKTFEDPAALKELLQAIKRSAQSAEVVSTREKPIPQASSFAHVPTTVKFSVDTTREQLMILLDICEELGIDGYVATNTSNHRDGLKTSEHILRSIGNGGLSGSAIAGRSLRMTQWLAEALGETKPIISVGGISTREEYRARLDAGASLVQVYTGLIYEGPSLVSQMLRP